MNQCMRSHWLWWWRGGHHRNIGGHTLIFVHFEGSLMSQIRPDPTKLVSFSFYPSADIRIWKAKSGRAKAVCSAGAKEPHANVATFTGMQGSDIILSHQPLVGCPHRCCKPPRTSPPANHFAKSEVETLLIQRAISNHSNITVSINTEAREWDWTKPSKSGHEDRSRLIDAGTG